MSILSWACIEEVYDCHLILDGALSVEGNFKLTHLYAESAFLMRRPASGNLLPGQHAGRAAGGEKISPVRLRRGEGHSPV